RRESPGDQLVLGGGGEPGLPVAGVHVLPVGEHHAGTRGELVGRAQRVPDQQPREQEQQARRAHQEYPVEQGQPQPYRRPQPPLPPGVVNGHVAATRYPAPTTVSISGGSPSFFRNVITVTRTVVVNGSVCASQTRSSS